MPCEEEKEGLKKMNQYVISLLEERRFRVETITNSNADYRPVITAVLDTGKDTTIGFFGHYDVEVADAERWSSNPWELTDVEGRWQARGVADNIVPLVQRILLLLNYPNMQIWFLCSRVRKKSAVPLQWKYTEFAIAEHRFVV